MQILSNRKYEKVEEDSYLEEEIEKIKHPYELGKIIFFNSRHGYYEGVL